MNKFYALVGVVGFVVVAGIIALMFLLSRISTGHVGVVYSINGGVQDEVLGQGWHITSFTEKVIEYPVRTQNKHYEHLSVATTDGKTIHMPVTIDYHVDPELASAVYNKFGDVSVESLEDGHIKTRVHDALRNTISDYTVIEAFGERIGDIKLETIEIAKAELGEAGIVIEDIMLSAPEPDAETQSAIDDRVKATQELERKRTDIEIAQAEAERKRIESEGEAEANAIIQESLSEEVLHHELINKWSGEQPIQIGGEGVIVDLPTSSTDDED